jgi:hypothetical protein
METYINHTENKFRKQYENLRNMTRGGYGNSFKAEITRLKMNEDSKMFIDWINSSDHRDSGSELSVTLVEKITESYNDEAPTQVGVNQTQFVFFKIN